VHRRPGQVAAVRPAAGAADAGTDGRDHVPSRRPRRPWLRRLLTLGVIVLLLPIPWRHASSGPIPATAWRLDGRLHVDGQPVDPPGRWTWLAIGRPQLVGEAIWEAVVGTDQPATDLRDGLVTRSPALAEPAAAAVGLRAAGQVVPLGFIVEVHGPLEPGYPERAIVVSIDGLDLTDRQAFDQAASGWEAVAGVPTTPLPQTIAFSLQDGREFTAPGRRLPYRVVSTLDVAPVELEASITFGFMRWLPFDWVRDFSLGSSHGLMVALTTYADASGYDLAQGRHVAGTGGIRGDGMVTRIGSLPAKARAAHRAGADVLVYPAMQVGELEGEDLDGMTLVPVRTLSEAVEWLAQPVA
jgi:hypothetical protein